MKVERKKSEVFEPIIITLETEEEASWMDTIACIKTDQTLEDCCKMMKQSLGDVDHFGANLVRELKHFLDC